MEFTKCPRLFVAADLAPSRTLELEGPQHHYIHHVMRMQEGDGLRLFNGRHGEWGAAIVQTGKRRVSLEIKSKLKDQPAQAQGVHLLYAPIKKNRLDFLIEKAVELGVTDLHPVITARTEVRKLNAERLQAQITEAAEQCERLDMPRLHPEMAADLALARWDTEIPVYACIERDGDALPLSDIVQAGPCAFLVGPEGGFDPAECERFARHGFLKPVSLGQNILRAETACVAALSFRLLRKPS